MKWKFAKINKRGVQIRSGLVWKTFKKLISGGGGGVYEAPKSKRISDTAIDS